MAMDSVSVKNLDLNFGSVEVLKNLNLDVKKGEFIVLLGSRSEERREGKECRSRWAPDHLTKTTIE